MYHIPEHKRGKLVGVQLCGSVWSCPVCAARISEFRKHEVERALITAQERGWRVLLLTYTGRHDRTDSLADFLGHQARGSRKKGTYEPGRGLLGARGYALGGGAAAKLYGRCGVMGSIRALEVTHGENGWHPHIHELLFVESAACLPELVAGLRQRWDEGLRLAGMRPVNDHGFDWTPANTEIAAYVQKMGHDRAWNVEHELTKQPTKLGRGKGRSPMQLLADFTEDGDAEAGALFVEYSHALKGRRQLYWSKGLREELGIEPELTEEQIVASWGAHGIHMARLTRPQFRCIAADGQRAQLVHLAGVGDQEALARFLASYPDMRRDRAVKTWRMELDTSDEIREAHARGLTKQEYLAWLAGGVAAIATPAELVCTRRSAAGATRRPQSSKEGGEVRCDKSSEVRQEVMCI